MQDRTHSFGYWLRRRRRALDLTQEALAKRVSCSVFSIRKVESDERRPSRRLAERLAASLAIPEHERREFLDAARAVHGTERLQLPGVPADAVGHDDSAGAAGRAAPDAPGAAAENTPFVGRRAEYDLLTGLVDHLGSGAGRTVLIEGEPGIGKSRLLREVARYARTRGVPTLVTKCYEIERAMPYQPVIDLVSRTLDGLAAATLDTLAPVSLAELAALVPDVAERVPGLPQLSDDFPEARQTRLSRAIGQLLEASRGSHPLIVVVDDIQWADAASAQVFHYLARAARERPILLVYAYRDEDADSDETLARLIDSLRREAAARRVPLSRLGAADTQTLVAAIVDSTPRAIELGERLHRETEGNPFFLTSILQSISEGALQIGPRAAGTPGWLPEALRAAVRVRLAHVPREVRPILETAAVIGRRFDFDTLLDVARQPEEQLLDALDALVKRRLLREESEGGVYDFSHDKVREVVYREIGGTRRRLLHRAVAEALERRTDAGAHERDPQLAEHFERAHVWSKALQYLVLAGERSQSLFAMRDALHWLDRAVALAESHPEAIDDSRRVAIYERRGSARALAGQTDGAVADIRRVVEAARAGGRRDQTRDALLQLGMAYRRADAYAAATACLTEALDESRAMNDKRCVADTLYHLGTVAWSTGVNDQAIAFHQQAVEIVEQSGFADSVAVQAYHGRGEAYFANAEPAAAIECFGKSLDIARAIGDKSYESENLMMIGHACVGSKGLGDYPRALANFDAALEIARAADLQWHLGPTLLGLDHAKACIGRCGEAWAGMHNTLGWLESLGQVRYQLIAHDLIGHLLLDLGLDDRAAEQLERGIALGQASGIMFWRATIAAQLAVARSRLGDKGLAPSLEAVLEQSRRTSERYLTIRCIDALAETRLADGKPQECLAYADELLAIAVPGGLREFEARARRWRGEVLLRRNAFAQAQAELEGAAAIVGANGRARLRMDLELLVSRVHAAQGRGEAARAHRNTATAIGAAIEASLAASGLTARLPPA